MDIILTREFEKRYEKLPTAIQKKAERQTNLFSKNPFYPSLHTEKLNPKGKEMWSFRIDRQYRIFFLLRIHAITVTYNFAMAN